MTTAAYCVNVSDFYRGADPSNGLSDSVAGNANIALCKEPISQLVDRYCLRGRHLLSLGAGRAFEEYWMANAGCSMTLVDLDLGPVARLEDHLSSLPGSSSGSETLDYVIGDAIEYCEHAPPATFDALYVSSLHPDEIRREAIQAAFVAERTEAARQSYLTWPKGTRPYSQYITAGWPLIADGGLAIMQHYRGGEWMSSCSLITSTTCRTKWRSMALACSKHGVFGSRRNIYWSLRSRVGMNISRHGKVARQASRQSPPSTVAIPMHPSADVIRVFPRPMEAKLRRNKTMLRDGASRLKHAVRKFLSPTR